MASQFVILILTVSTIFLVIGMCIPLPYVSLGDCNKNVPHVVVVNSTGKISNCVKCTICQEGHGLSTPCNGQNVSKKDLNVECKPCVAGVNFSTGETIQCQPCQRFCQDGMKIKGKCEVTGDKRTCERCELKDWYYNMTQEICLPCVCKNMTADIKRICRGLGFNVQQCNKNHSATKPTTSTSVPLTTEHKNDDVWDMKYTTIIVGVCVSIVLMIAYGCCITKHIKKLNINYCSPWNKELLCQIFCFKDPSRSRPPSYHSDIAEDRHAQNGNGCAEHARFLRQSSCPVTQNEKLVIKNSPHASLKQGDSQENVKFLGTNTECKQKKMKFFDMNAETCREILQKLKQNIETGMGFPTLAGSMGFSANEVKNFEYEGDVCVNMLECWSNLDDRNNVLQLKEFVALMRRDDILKLLKSELQKKRDECGCSECSVCNT